MSQPTDDDRQRAAEVLDYYRRNYITPDTFEQVIAQALADERERTLASCYGRHEHLELVVGGPGIVTCDGHELRWTAR